MMTTNHPEWHPEQHTEYDERMADESAALLERLQTDSSYRRSILADPKIVHKRLYMEFAPTTHPEYAGSYRGASVPSLEHRSVSAPSFLLEGKNFEFVKPNNVLSEMNNCLQNVKLDITAASSHWEQLRTLSSLFSQFGFIHPFLDGNGHVQRTLFAAAALEMGLPLSNRFAIHPRSYDFLLAYALEGCIRIPSQREQWLSAIAEYVAQWLGGPFDAPGMGLAPLEVK